MGMLEGKVAIVTGAGRGLGRSHALAMAAEQVVESIRAAGGAASASYDDVASWEGAERLVRQAVERHGRLDIVVDNAGILRDRMLFSMGEDDWDSVRVHLKGHFAPSRFACVYWRERHRAERRSPGASSTPRRRPG